MVKQETISRQELNELKELIQEEISNRNLFKENTFIKTLLNQISSRSNLNLTEKVEELKKVKDSGNIDDIKTTMDGLNAFWSSVASKMYDTANPDGDTPEPETESDPAEKKKKEGEIEDADFEVVD